MSNEYFEESTETARPAIARPRAGIARPSAPEAEVLAPREEEESTEAPRSVVKRPSALKGGWGEGQRMIDSTSSYMQTLKLDSNTVVVKLLEDAPFVAYGRHWIERYTDGKKSNRPYPCLSTFGQECPLCDIGLKPQAVNAFNVAIVDDDGSVNLKAWEVGVKLFRVLKNFNSDPKVGPLSKGFFGVNKSGTGSQVQYNAFPIKASNLFEDYGVALPDPDALDSLDRYTPDVITPESMGTMRELAAEYASADD